MGSGVKRTSIRETTTSANDPKRTSYHGAKAGICLGLSVVVNRPGGDMQRRGSSGQPVKGQRTSRPKARKALTAPTSPVELQEQLDRRTHELDESREQQTATAEILKVSQPFDLRPADRIRHDRRQRCASLPRTHGCGAPIRWQADSYRRPP